MGNSRDKKLYTKTKLTMTGWFDVHYKRLQQRERMKFGKDFYKRYCKLKYSKKLMVLSHSNLD